MKSTKSKLVNYDKLYNTILTALTFCFLYIEINFFLPLSNYISFFFVSLACLCFIFYSITKARFSLILALCTALISIIFSLLTLYL